MNWREANHQGFRMSVSSNIAPLQPSDHERRTLQLLIVDDDATQRALIAVAAKQAGHVVTIATSCSEAISAIGDKRFDCISLDLMLEDGEGTDVLRAISNARFTGSVVVISGMDAERRTAARLYARSIGITLQSLPKPLDLAALRIYLANLSKTAMGLPMVHNWGGIAANSVASNHRS